MIECDCMDLADFVLELEDLHLDGSKRGSLDICSCETMSCRTTKVRNERLTFCGVNISPGSILTVDERRAMSLHVMNLLVYECNKDFTNGVCL